MSALAEMRDERLHKIIYENLSFTGDETDFVSTKILTLHLAGKGLDIKRGMRSAQMIVAKALLGMGLQPARENGYRGDRGFIGIKMRGSEIEQASSVIASDKPRSGAGSIRDLINAVLDEREKRDPPVANQRALIGNWLDSLIRARESGDAEQLAATVDSVIDAMSDLLF
jgi:hypothetical protein